MKFLKTLFLATFALALSACAGFERGCSSSIATEFGADWVVVEVSEMSGIPYRCWILEDVSITNEQNSDGIYWKSSDGHLIHVSGSYDYVQVHSRNFTEALAEVNMTEDACQTVSQRRFNPITNAYELPDPSKHGR